MAEQQPSVADELRKLAVLKRDGVLSEEEFAAAKADLLRAIKASSPPELCEECKGTKVCSECGGTGRGTRPARDFSGGYKECECRRCDGNRRCWTCKGTGHKPPGA